MDMMYSASIKTYFKYSPNRSLKYETQLYIEYQIWQ